MKGGAFIFHRGDELNARRFFDAGQPPPFNFGQFGAARRADRRAEPGRSSSSATKARAAIARPPARRRPRRKRCAAAISRRSRRRFAVYTQQPFPGNIIPANRLSPQAQALLQPSRCRIRPASPTTTSRPPRRRRRRTSKLRPRRSSVVVGDVAVRTRGGEEGDVVHQLNPNFKSYRSAGESELRARLHARCRALADRCARGLVRESTPNRTGREGADIDPLRDPASAD